MHIYLIEQQAGALQHMSTYLSKERGLASLVLGDLVGSVLAALLALAECLSLLRNIDHD